MLKSFHSLKQKEQNHTLKYALSLKRTVDVAIVRTDAKFFRMDR